MTSSMVIPVIDVQNNNFSELWPAMLLSIKTCSFVALDTELSGLGNRKSLLAECIEERYKAICLAARSRSILSLGIACYKKQYNKDADTYLIQVYNITLLCSEEYMIEPQSVQFLVQHGFDFNKQYAQGVPYYKGNNRGGADNQGIGIRALFLELLRARKPLVLHNGLIDMVFLYQCFYAHLPERLATFTADLSEMFPAGVYDTKYATEYELRLTASYLEYAYKKCKLDNSRSVASGGTGPHVHVEFCQYTDQMSSYVDYRGCPPAAPPEGPADVCRSFSAFGWCPSGFQCPLSHNTDLIILQDEKGQGEKKNKKRKKRAKKRGKGEGPEGSSIFEGAPENKVPHVELDPEEAPEKPQEKPDEPRPESGPPPGAEQAVDPSVGALPATTQSIDANGAAVHPADRDANSQPHEEAECMKSDDEGKEGREDDAQDPTKVTVGSESPMGGERENPAADSAKIVAKKKKNLEAGTHRAGFDAFMTGYIFAYSCALGRTEQLPECLNKVYLSGKAAPLRIVKSTFTMSSRAHLQKMATVWGPA